MIRDETLLWGQGLYQELKFVLVEYDGVQSQTTGAYDSHFWTKALPKLDRYRRRGAGDSLEGIDSESATRRILKTFRAYERYTFMSLVAHGITQILPLELADRNYRSPLYMRTKPNTACSEENIIKDLGSLFLRVLHRWT